MTDQTENSVSFIDALLARRTVKRAFKVCLIVGTILCLINQWEAITSGFNGVDWLKVILTYIVPYSVSSFSSAASRLDCEHEKASLIAEKAGN